MIRIKGKISRCVDKNHCLAINKISQIPDPLDRSNVIPEYGCTEPLNA